MIPVIMKKITIAFLFAISFLFVHAAENENPYHLNFAEFDELKVVDGINVDYICDASRAGDVEFYATKECASAVMFSHSGSRLTIELASSETPYRNLPTIKVYSKYLTNISNEGDSLVRVLSVAPTPKFSCRVIGNGRLSIRNIEATTVNASILSGHGLLSIYGKADQANLKITGTGTIQADELKADKVSCTSAGTGTITCYPAELLSVGGLGGTVQYRGRPEVKKRFLTSVKIVSLD